MTRHKLHLAALVAILGLTAPAWAQTKAPTSPSDSFQSMSPGNQKIARALFDIQQPTATGPAPLSLDQIADLKANEGWGEVFKQMKTEGLVDSKNLGAAVSSYERANNAHTMAGTRSGEKAVVVTTGNGRTITAGLSRSTPSGVSSHGHSNDAERAIVGVTTAGGSTMGASGGISASRGSGVANGSSAGHGR